MTKAGLLPLLLLLALAPALRAELVDDFEAPETTWKFLSSDSAARVDRHERVIGQARRGQGSEHFRLTAGGGTFAYVAREIGRARFIDEFSPTVWVKGDRAGIQLLVRVVLPRSRDERLGRPHSILLRGTSTTRAGTWEQLTLPEPGKQLKAQLRVQRLALSSDLDTREAYVDLILLNAYTGPGPSGVWIDDLELTGVVTAGPGQPGDAPLTPGVSATRHDSAVRPAQFLDTAPRPEATPLAGGPPPRMTSGLLQADGKPLFPRIIEHRGESFDTLKTLGFNTIKLREMPTSMQLSDARRLALWLIVPAPQVVPGQLVSPDYDRVLAWDVGSGLSAQQFETTRQLAEAIKQADRAAGRPVIGAPVTRWLGYSRCLDLLVADSNPLYTSRELVEWGGWLRERPQIARPGTPMWAAIPTEPPQTLLRQLGQLAPDALPLTALQPEQVRLAALTAIAAGSRGLVFTSRTALAGDDLAARLRVATAELVNLELAPLEPWAAAGSFLSEVEAAPGIRVSALSADRAMLLLALRQRKGSQFNAEIPASETISFVIPGASEGGNAYRISPTGMQPLRHKRVAGGVRVTLDDFAHAAAVVFTDNPLVIGGVSRKLAAMQLRAAQLHYEIADLTIRQIEEIDRRLAQQGRSRSQLASSLAEARGHLQRTKTLVDTGEATTAQQMAARAIHAAGRVRQAHTEALQQGFLSPVVSPLCVHFASAPQHFLLADRLRTITPGPNLLVGGEFEDLEHLVSGGWRHFRDQESPVQSHVQLLPQEAASGRFALQLRVSALDTGSGAGQSSSGVVESPPVWIVSPPITVEAGRMVRIAGQVRVPEPIVGSQDGLLIFDNFGGLDLALRLRHTGRWQPFVLYRAVDRAEPLTLTFALTGIGEAQLDQVTVSVLGHSR